MEKWYVVTTDTFMSGRGKADGKINKLVFVCNSEEQAEIVKDNAENRSDQTDVDITDVRPDLTEEGCYIQVKTIKKYPSWYKEGYFAKQ